MIYCSKEIFIHEMRLLSILSPGFNLSSITVKAAFGPDAIISQPFMLNETFTLYFKEEELSERLRLLGTDLALPHTIGNEVHLVVSDANAELAYVEYMGPTLPESHVLEPSIRALNKSTYDILSESRSKRMVSQLCDYLLHGKVCKGDLKYARFFVIDHSVMFFLSTSNKLLLQDPDSTIDLELKHGQLRQCFLGKDLALDGWLEIS